MKKQSFLLLTVLLVFASCVVKSLEPFYTKKSVSYDEKLVGTWSDSKNGKWMILSFKEEMKKEKSPNEIKESEKDLYEIYKESYYIAREYKGNETTYIATPFKVKGQTFLDFLPIDNQDGIDNLLEKHLVYTHSLVKYTFDENGSLNIKWLDEDRIEDLFEKKKIKIQHHKIGIVKDKYLLTASSEDLEKFIEKYISSDDEKKWKTDTKYTLTPFVEAE